MEIQRVRNLTTGILHTEMNHIYQDIEYLTGEKGIMTHMLPRACEALLPHLRKIIPDKKFWDTGFDLTHIGDIDIQPLTDEEKSDFWKRYDQLPNPLDLLSVSPISVVYEK